MDENDETMIDRVARAIRACPSWSSFWSEADSRVMARAAIGAMREPTQAMNRAANKTPAIGGHLAEWRAMIDAALED